MLVFLITGVVLIVFIILGLIGEEKGKDSLSFIGFFGTLISSVVLVCLICCIKTKRSIECDINNYNELKRAVEQTGGKNLEEKVLEFNNKIDENRVKSESLWISCFYSKEVGNLKKLDYIK